MILALTGEMVLAKITYLLLAFSTQKMRGIIARNVNPVYYMLPPDDNVLRGYNNTKPEHWPNPNSRTSLLRESVYYTAGKRK